ncbi:MAG: YibE/F family protein [Cyanobacteria bacterium SZAS LIN-2]|nr:YibE/F family protein [Cyanobacteria bacterium SZAS LIN-2]MBS2007215.1 YibE/F family protein [Cyanobacteria bacterium SZAS TMP-1]
MSDRAQAPAAVKNGFGEEEFVVAKVLSVGQPTLNQDLKASTGMVATRSVVNVEIVEGKLKGKTVDVYNEITDNPAFNVICQPGKEVVLSVITTPGGKYEVNIADYHRAPVLGGLLLVFLVLFIFFGGKQGVKSLVALVISVALIAFVLLPLSLQGFNPLIVAVFICLVSTGTSMYFVAGASKKCLAAILGTLGGVIAAGIAAHLVIDQAPLTGLSSEEAQILRGSLFNQPPRFYAGLLAAGMLIGALGVIMDVGISVASTVAEVAKNKSSATVKELYQSGMNVGRDIMGTMTNTLILAYTGSALPLLMLISQIPSNKLINLDLVATEVASAISGSLGLVLTIPLTAYFAARLMATDISNQEK